MPDECIYLLRGAYQTILMRTPSVLFFNLSNLHKSTNLPSRSPRQLVNSAIAKPKLKMLFHLIFANKTDSHPKEIYADAHFRMLANFVPGTFHAR